MSSPPRTYTEVGAADYSFVKENVEGMTDKEIAQELGVSLTAVERMRSDLGLRRKDGNGFHGKITSPGIEPIATFERRMKDRLREEGVTGDEARMFMRSFLLNRAREIDWCEYRMRRTTLTAELDKKAISRLRELKAECYFRINTYER